MLFWDHHTDSEMQCLLDFSCKVLVDHVMRLEQGDTDDTAAGCYDTVSVTSSTAAGAASRKGRQHSGITIAATAQQQQRQQQQGAGPVAGAGAAALYNVGPELSGAHVQQQQLLGMPQATSCTTAAADAGTTRNTRMETEEQQQQPSLAQRRGLRPKPLLVAAADAEAGLLPLQQQQQPALQQPPLSLPGSGSCPSPPPSTPAGTGQCRIVPGERRRRAALQLAGGGSRGAARRITESPDAPSSPVAARDGSGPAGTGSPRAGVGSRLALPGIVPLRGLRSLRSLLLPITGGSADAAGTDDARVAAERVRASLEGGAWPRAPRRSRNMSSSSSGDGETSSGSEEEDGPPQLAPLGSFKRSRPGASMRWLACSIGRASGAPGRLVHQQLSAHLLRILERQVAALPPGSMPDLPLQRHTGGASSSALPHHALGGTAGQQHSAAASADGVPGPPGLLSMSLQALGLGAVAAEAQEGRPGGCMAFGSMCEFIVQ